MTYTRSLVERTLPLVLGGQPGSTTGRARRYRACRQCDPRRGRERCTHRCDLSPACISTFEGDEFGICQHVHNGRRAGGCGVCWCLGADDRRATSAPDGSSAPVVLVDVRRAWECSPWLLRMHRRRMYERYALDWPVGRIAQEEGVSASSVSRTLTAGLDAIVSYLEGKT